GIITRVNEAFCARTGFAAEELIGRPLDDLTPVDDRDGRPWPRVEEGVREIERRFLRRDGSVGWALWQHSMTRDLDGRPAAYVSHCLDISLLEAVAERLRRVLRPDDVIARFGGDEFTVLLANVHDERHALRVADRLAGALRAPLVLDGEQRFITASVGLSLAGPGDDRAEPQALLRDADAAMYRAKELGKARCEVFDDSMRQRAVERLELESAL